MENHISINIGNTDLVRLSALEKYLGTDSRIFAKLEFQNPFGSIKDRSAYQILTDAEKAGSISDGYEIIEASSGNLGISLAAMCKAKGYSCSIVVNECVSKRKIELIEGYGANVIYSSKNGGIKESVSIARELAKSKKESFFTDQFNNYSSVAAHINSTGPEIFNKLDGKADLIICGIGSGGTATGLYEYFKNTPTEIIGVLPEIDDNIEGIGAGFVPRILDKSIYYKAIRVSSVSAVCSRNELYTIEGMHVGYSSGAVISAYKALSMRYPKDLKGKNIVLIFADSGDRYE